MKLITTIQYLTILKTKKDVESHLNNIKVYYGKNNANKVTVIEL